MSAEEIKEQTGAGALPSNDSELPEAFTKVLDAIDEGSAQEGIIPETPKESAEPDSQIPAEAGEITEPVGEKETPEGDVSVETDEEILESIDPGVLDVWRDAGYDDDEIIAEMKKRPEMADDIREAIDEAEVQKTRVPVREPEKPVVKEEAIEELKLNLDPDMVGADVKTAIDKIVDAVNVSRKEAQQIRKELLIEKEAIQVQKNAIHNERIDRCFDRFTKQVPSLGRSSKLSKYNSRIRHEIYDHAAVISRTRGTPIEEAIGQEVRLWQYRYQKPDALKKEAQQTVLDKLNKQKGRFTNPPGRTPSKSVKKQFASEAEEADYTVRQIDEKYAAG